MGISFPTGSVSNKSIPGTLSNPPGKLSTGETPAPPYVPPSASGVTLSGTFETGSLLTGSYTYSGSNPESGSTFQWWQADDELGTGTAAIAGAASITYTVEAEIQGKYISMTVTPSDGIQIGVETSSPWYGPVGPLMIVNFTQPGNLVGSGGIQNKPPGFQEAVSFHLAGVLMEWDAGNDYWHAVSGDYPSVDGQGVFNQSGFVVTASWLGAELE